MLKLPRVSRSRISRNTLGAAPMESVKALFSNAPAGPALPSSGAPYRLVYFNCRGAVEHVRLLLALSGERWDDVRYPLGAAAAGFAPAERFRAERDAGAFAANMGALPVLVVRGEGDGDGDGESFTLGQSHAIARFLARRHGLMGATPREAAAVDCLYECVRDVKAEWFRVKAEADDAARRDARRRWWASGLRDACARLEAAARAAAPAAAGPWLVGARATLADVAVYHLLGTSVSVASGCELSFFDGDADAVRAALAPHPRLAAAVAAVGALPAVREWEERRPDTFS